jgi:NAD(P)-dependent dehydrogenase (short-subunit alcohol dehydrogenase family)
MENKACILITGASSGMGREMAIRFSAFCRVILNGRDAKRLEETKQLCTNPAEHLVWQYDLAKVEELENSFIAFISEHRVQVNYFVHCAGLMKAYPLKMVTAALFRDTYNVNVISGALLVKSLMNRKLNDTALKSVVFISSNISNFGAKAFSVYGSSKGAVDALMRSLAVEMAPRVRVNSVLPGGVRTAMTEHMYQDQELIDRMAGMYPLGLGEIGDIYEAVNFLLSDQAKWVTGQQLTVDGGRTINITG